MAFHIYLNIYTKLVLIHFGTAPLTFITFFQISRSVNLRELHL